MLWDTSLECSLSEKDLGCRGMPSWTGGRNEPSRREGFWYLGCVRRSVVSSLRQVTLSRYSSLARPHVECSAQCWVPQHERDTDAVERIPRGPRWGLTVWVCPRSKGWGSWDWYPHQPPFFSLAYAAAEDVTSFPVFFSSSCFTYNLKANAKQHQTDCILSFLLSFETQTLWSCMEIKNNITRMR